MAEAPTTDEKYSRACNASNLALSEHREGAADVLIASGWSASRLGSALMRLRSEFDSWSRPPDVLVSQMSASLYMSHLTSYRGVRDQCVILLAKWPETEQGRERDAASSILLYWLMPQCKVCGGTLTKPHPIRGRVECKACNQTGRGKAPFGDAGKKLANHMDDCVDRARQSILDRLKRS